MEPKLLLIHILLVEKVRYNIYLNKYTAYKIYTLSFYHLKCIIYLFKIAKWMMSNGLVMLLPHGYDGAASEHSSCRMERFLQLTDSKECLPDGDDINLQIINPSTPAQYYHALRRQMIRDYRKPLIVIAPKTLLRLSEATSSHNDFQPGSTFLPVIGDDIVNPTQVKKVLLCSGKHYYNLNNERLEKKFEDVAIIRVESLCPFPVQEINNELDKYKNAKCKFLLFTHLNLFISLYS